uniref:Variable large protein n=1 Tax=Romanomermis culicivorax TaxID=13658 RepID=A0A915K0J2_ROMCU
MEHQFTLDENMALFVVVEGVKHQTTMKCKTSDDGDANVSATKIAGKGDDVMKIVGEEGYDATKIIEKGVDATKIAGEAGDATEDRKAVKY